MAKGSAFERRFCKQLSLWWSKGQHDDLFWRTAGSGARATVRGRKGKRTKGHCGDICATDEAGKPLLDLVTLELKRGYNRATLVDLLDKPAGGAEQCWEAWISQALESAQYAATKWWMIVAKRDQRGVMVCIPAGLFQQLRSAWADISYMQLVFKDRKGKKRIVCCFPFENWCQLDPGVLLKLS
jgi:hypothetical protein